MASRCSGVELPVRVRQPAGGQGGRQGPRARRRGGGLRRARRGGLAAAAAAAVSGG